MPSVLDSAREELLKRIPFDDTASLLRRIEAEKVLEGRMLERERCAKIADKYANGAFNAYSNWSEEIAEEIRKGE